MSDPKTITEFNGQYRFLSNFYLEPDDTCVEREYQMRKCKNPHDMKKFADLSPGQCKRLGRSVAIRPDWERVKLDIMRDLVWQKFVDHQELKRLLLATGDVDLEEGNTWGDRFWGKVNGEGQNWLGNILMETRRDLRKLEAKR